MYGVIIRQFLYTYAFFFVLKMPSVSLSKYRFMCKSNFLHYDSVLFSFWLANSNSLCVYYSETRLNVQTISAQNSTVLINKYIANFSIYFSYKMNKIYNYIDVLGMWLHKNTIYYFWISCSLTCKLRHADVHECIYESLEVCNVQRSQYERILENI